MRLWIQKLFRPSATRSIITLVTIGILLGVVGLLGFDFSLHATSTEKFCISCHEMEANPYAQLKKTSHYNNAAGVRPTCSDCHVPKEFVPKMIRKIEAAREVWGTIIGKINTPEKYIAHTPVMKAREIGRLKANDSQECRNCHEVDRMLLAVQSVKAREYHVAMRKNDKTCIDCHAGIAHPENSGNNSPPGH
jgi:cytochrome c-type protein NapC